MHKLHFTRIVLASNKWYLFKNFLQEKSFCWCAAAAASHFYLTNDNFPRYSQKQPSGRVLQNSCSKTSYKILKKLWVVEWFCSLKIKKYISKRTFSSEISQIFQSSFSNTFGRLLPWKKIFKKQPSESVPWNSCSEIFEITRKLSIIKCFGR